MRMDILRGYLASRMREYSPSSYPISLGFFVFMGIVAVIVIGILVSHRGPYDEERPSSHRLAPALVSRCAGTKGETYLVSSARCVGGAGEALSDGASGKDVMETRQHMMFPHLVEPK